MADMMTKHDRTRQLGRKRAAPECGARAQPGKLQKIQLYDELGRKRRQWCG